MPMKCCFFSCQASGAGLYWPHVPGMAAPNEPPTLDLKRLPVKWTGKAVESLYPPHHRGLRRRSDRQHLMQEA